MNNNWTFVFSVLSVWCVNGFPFLISFSVFYILFFLWVVIIWSRAGPEFLSKNIYATSNIRFGCCCWRYVCKILLRSLKPISGWRFLSWKKFIPDKTWKWIIFPFAHTVLNHRNIIRHSEGEKKILFDWCENIWLHCCCCRRSWIYFFFVHWIIIIIFTHYVFVFRYFSHFDSNVCT